MSYFTGLSVPSVFETITAGAASSMRVSSIETSSAAEAVCWMVTPVPTPRTIAIAVESRKHTTVFTPMPPSFLPSPTRTSGGRRLHTTSTPTFSVSLSAGFSITPEECWLKFYRVDSPMTDRLFYAVLPKRSYTSRAVRRFIEIFGEVMRTLGHKNGGNVEIRTLGGLLLRRSPSARLRPLGHVSTQREL